MDCLFPGITHIKLKHVFKGHIRNQRDIQVNEWSMAPKCPLRCDSINPTKDLSCLKTSVETGIKKF